MKLSIIIVSYNTKSVLDDCLTSIYAAQWTSAFEVIVVDNNSQDGSVDMLHAKYPQVKVIANPDNKLFAIANNQGAAIAEGEYLLLLNSDTLVWGNNLQKMIDFFDTLSADVICVGPRVLNKDKSLQSCGYPNSGYRERITLCFKLHKIFRPKWIETFFGLKGLPRDTQETRQVGWVSGCCMMMRKALYNKIGGLNENIEFYGEEPEFGYRSLRLGYQTLYFPDAEIIHLGGISTPKEKTEEELRKEEATRLRRYAKLQQETVGYSKAIRMSQIVIFAAYLKRFIAKDKAAWDEAIAYEKRVVEYLKQEQAKQ